MKRIDIFHDTKAMKLCWAKSVMGSNGKVDKINIQIEGKNNYWFLTGIFYESMQVIARL